MKAKYIIGATILSALSVSSYAYEQGDIILKFGAATVQPNGDGAMEGRVDVEGDTQIGLTLTYMLSQNLGLNLLASTPFTHDIKLDGNKIGEASHLPPTLTLQYHFNSLGTVKPYVGAGINYTTFFDEESSLGDLSLDSSIGYAFEGGLDVEINESWGANISFWYMDIDTDASLDGDESVIGTVEVDPWVAMIGAVYKF